MLVFDVTNKASFEKLDAWLQEFYDHGGKGAVVLVVGNKVRSAIKPLKLQAEQNLNTIHFEYLVEWQTQETDK